MSYSSFPFPSSTPLFPPAATVLEYLNAFATRFNLVPMIRFNTTVHSIDWDSDIAKWRVRVGPTRELEGASYELLYDLVIAANGHYRIPYYPETPGLSVWLDAGRASHSAWYRRPQGLGNSVMVVGGGPSGMDIADELQLVCATTVHSIAGAQATDDPAPAGVRKVRGRVVEFMDVEKGTVRFADGSTESGIDRCILATGYKYSMPFLPKSLLELSFPPAAPPLPDKLYNSSYHIFPLAKHLFPLIPSLPPSSLAFLTLPYGVAHLPFIETQMRTVLKALSHPHSIDLVAETNEVLARYQKLRTMHPTDDVAFARAWHNLNDAEQLQYRNDMHHCTQDMQISAEFGMVPVWVHEVFENKVVLRKEWQELVKRGEASKWVQGVGEAGGEEGVQQWLDLMRRIVGRAQCRQAHSQ